MKEGSRFCTACGAEANRKAPADAVTVGAAVGAAAQTEGTGSGKAARAEAPIPQAQTKTVSPTQGGGKKPKSKGSGASPLSAGSVLREAGRVMENTAAAPASAGEISFTRALSPAGEIAAAVGPFKCLADGVIGLAKGFGAALRDKKRWLSAAVLAVVWLALTLLPFLGVNPPAVRWLSFATFAGGGTTGGLTGLVGGVVGKGVFAYFLTSLVLPLTRGQKPFAGVAGGLRRFFPSLAAKGPAQLSGVLAGMGAALIGYNFMVGPASLQNSMAGVAAFLLSLRALSGRAGFLRRFAGSLTTAFRKDKRADTQVLGRLLAGWAAGFALAVPLSALPFAWIGYTLGGFILLGAIVLKIVSGGKREVTG